jgi:hypothetical protein
LKRAFPGENAKFRAFCGGEKLETEHLYHPSINELPRLRKSTLRLRGFLENVSKRDGEPGRAEPQEDPRAR